jgi:hypothetical protein
MKIVTNALPRTGFFLAGALILTVGLTAALPAAAHVSLSIQYSSGQPAFVVVPGTPVYYGGAPGCDIYRYGGSYYARYGGSWYRGSCCPGEFRPIARRAVPRVVLSVIISPDRRGHRYDRRGYRDDYYRDGYRYDRGSRVWQSQDRGEWRVYRVSDQRGPYADDPRWSDEDEYSDDGWNDGGDYRSTCSSGHHR